MAKKICEKCKKRRSRKAPFDPEHYCMCKIEPHHITCIFCKGWRFKPGDDPEQPKCNCGERRTEENRNKGSKLFKNLGPRSRVSVHVGLALIYRFDKQKYTTQRRAIARNIRNEYLNHNIRISHINLPKNYIKILREDPLYDKLVNSRIKIRKDRSGKIKELLDLAQTENFEYI